MGYDPAMRARDLAIEFDGEPGPHNAITDVPGVRVGHHTLIAGDDIRTGVSAVLPRPPEQLTVPVNAGVAAFNGFGEMTGVNFVREAGRFAGPIALTGTNSIGAAHAGVLKWMVKHHGPSALDDWTLPVVAETWDGWLHRCDDFTVTEEHVARALDAAAAGAVVEGGVGGGTGMTCYGFKGGIGSASRRVTVGDHHCTVGVLLQANFGRRDELVVRGDAVGRSWAAEDAGQRQGDGSVIVLIATDAPLLPYQLARVARRATVGIARTGTCGRNGSGDMFLAFSVANREALAALETSRAPLAMHFVPDSLSDPLFEATARATEEAVLNALASGEAMSGHRGHRIGAFADRWRLHG
jgi:L-aminopeptidase/D-esterase-like protein